MLRAIKNFFDFSEYAKVSSIASSYAQAPSISSKLSWEEFDAQNKYLRLSDGKSVAAIYELSTISTEAKDVDVLAQIQKQFESIFVDAFEHYFDQQSPWIIQFYVSDELTLRAYYERFRDYVQESVKDSQFTKVYQRFFKEHMEYMVKKEGLFVDNLSGNVFHGRVRKVRAVIYRSLHSRSAMRRGWTPEKDLQTTCASFEAKIKDFGIVYKRYDEQDFYFWMARWFNPSPKGYKTTNELLEKVPYPKGNKPDGFELTVPVFGSSPKSDDEHGIWYFDNKPHKYLTVIGLRDIPEVGHLSAEKAIGKDQSAKYYALFDKFPQGSVFQITVVLQSQEFRKNHLERIEKKARKGSTAEAQLALEEAQVAKRMIANGKGFFPVCMGVYIAGNDLQDLELKEVQATAVLKNNKYEVINSHDDVTKLDSYFRYLPANYDFEYDKKHLIRSRLLSLPQIAKLIPLYGRSNGSGNPLAAFFNRLGEPNCCDPFSKSDKSNNSHNLILGTTGSGKSATCAYLMMQIMAVYRPRMVVLDAGKSFKLLMEFFKAMGLKVNMIEVTVQKPDFTLNPFVETKKMLTQVDSAKRQSDELIESEIEKLEDEIISQYKPATENEIEKEENRDYLSEFLTAANLMITGGETKEIDDLTRQDRYMVLEAITAAARKAVNDGFDQMTGSDLANSLNEMAKQANASDNRAEQAKAIRLTKMADGLNTFLSSPLNSMYFDTRGEPLPDADITWFELGLFKDDRPENEAPRSVAFITMMNAAMSMAEKYQSDDRFSLFFGDECHVVTSKPITAASVTQCAKMSRKVGLWLWLATQNTSDFPDSASKTLSMMEFKTCLGMAETEIQNINKLHPLTDEQLNLFRSVRKVPGKYVEGVLLSKNSASLFRNVPPRLALSLAMTEKVEKAERSELMERFNCTELEAACLVAERMAGNELNIDKVRELLGND